MAEQVGAGLPAPAQQPVDRDQHQEDHAGGAEIAERAVLVLAVRVHHGEDGGQRLGGEVVVEDDHVAAGGGERLVRERAAVDADDQVVALAEPAHRRDVRAVALVDAVGDVERRRAAHPPQPDHDERRRGAAVDVVVGEDRDPLARADRAQEALRRLSMSRSDDGSGIRSRSAGARCSAASAGPTPRRARTRPTISGRPVAWAMARPSRSTSGSGPSQRRPVTERSTPR